MRRSLPIAAVVVGLLAVAGVGFAVSGTSQDSAAIPRVSEGVNVVVELMSIDTARRQMAVKVVVLPEGTYLNQSDYTFARPVRVTSHWAVDGGSSTRDISVGQPVGVAVDLVLAVDGDVQKYPFDRYDYAFADPGRPGPITAVPLVTIDTIDAGGRATQPVPIGLASEPGGLQGWTDDWQLAVQGSTLSAKVHIGRSGAVLTFVLLVVVLVAGTALLAGSVAWAVATARRPLEPPLAGWFAALLFALIPLRNFLPGVPAIGAWIDVWVFYWVELVLLASMGLFIISWFRFRDQPDYSGLQRFSAGSETEQEDSPDVGADDDGSG